MFSNISLIKAVQDLNQAHARQIIHLSSRAHAAESQVAALSLVPQASAVVAHGLPLAKHVLKPPPPRRHPRYLQNALG